MPMRSRGSRIAVRGRLDPLSVLVGEEAVLERRVEGYGLLAATRTAITPARLIFLTPTNHLRAGIEGRGAGTIRAKSDTKNGNDTTMQD